MKLILWRHADAAYGGHDLSRPLTDLGRLQAQQTADELRHRLPEDYVLWASEAVRSQETAAALRNPDRILAELNPDADFRRLPALSAETEAGQTLVLVGHQPWIGMYCAQMGGTDGAAFAKSAACLIEYDAASRQGCVVWQFVPPATAAA